MAGTVPLSLWLEAQDVLFLIKLMNDPPDNFNITDYISFVSSSTRVASKNRIKRTIPLKPHLNTTSCRHLYFNRMVRLWNLLPNIDLQLPFNSIKRHILDIFWQVFIQQFDVNNSCTWFNLYLVCVLNVLHFLLESSLTLGISHKGLCPSMSTPWTTVALNSLIVFISTL